MESEYSFPNCQKCSLQYSLSSILNKQYLGSSYSATANYQIFNALFQTDLCMKFLHLQLLEATAFIHLNSVANFTVTFFDVS